MAEKRRCQRCGSGEDVRTCRRKRFVGSFTDYCGPCRERYQGAVEMDEPKTDADPEPEAGGSADEEKTAAKESTPEAAPARRPQKKAKRSRKKAEAKA